MTKIVILPSEQIKETLKFNITLINKSLSNLESEQTDEQSVYYSKLYIDFSTAIEACYRGIIKNYCSAGKIGKIIDCQYKPDEGGEPAYFFNYEKFKTIVTEGGIESFAHKQDFQLLGIDFFPNNESKIKTYAFDEMNEVKGRYEKCITPSQSGNT